MAGRLDKEFYEAMLKGDLKVVAGFSNEVRAAVSHVAPDSTLAQCTAALQSREPREQNNENLSAIALIAPESEGSTHA